MADCLADRKSNGPGLNRRWSLLIFVWPLWLFGYGDSDVQATNPPVIINEVLANEPGSTVALEWVELYNRADTSIDLSTYIFIDAGDTTELKGLVLSPGGYGVLSRRLTGTPGQDAFETHWGDGSGLWGDAGGENFPALEVSFKLRNSADTVSLYGPNGFVSSFFWDQTTADGVSRERIRPASPDQVDSFSPSKDSSGSTPGRMNSHTPRPNDLAFDSMSILITPDPPREDELLTFAVLVNNIGLGTTAANLLTIGDDANRNGVIDPEEILTSTAIPPMDEGQAITIFHQDNFAGGVHHLIFNLGDDGNAANNNFHFVFKVTYVMPEIVINEYLPDPLPGLSEEWIELYNRSPWEINLTGWRIGDSIAQRKMTTIDLVIPPGGYLVVCENLAAFTITYPSVPESLVQQLNLWRSLNNYGDRLVLIDDFGLLVDAVSYETIYGGRSIERIAADTQASQPDNWSPSLAVAGATPAGINSHTRRPNDLALDSATIQLFPNPPREGQSLTIDVPVSNVGLGNSLPNTLTLGEDLNGDDLLAVDEILVVRNIPALGENETRTISHMFDIYGGVHPMYFVIGEDGNSINNSAAKTFKVSYALPEVIINEYLADPPAAGSEEWVELYNRSEQAIDLRGWQLGDSTAQSLITDQTMIVAPGDYIIVCENRLAIESTYDNLSLNEVLELDNWRSLNNSGDRVVLLDDFGLVVDSLSYTTTFDGQRSTERIDPDQASGNNDNWWGSVDPAGATPGRINSTTVTYGTGLQVSVLPNPFAVGETVQINYTVSLGVMMSAEIFDINGRLIKTFFRDQPVVSGSIEWDGVDEFGRVLSPGVYVLLIQTDRGSTKKIVLSVSPVR